LFAALEDWQQKEEYEVLLPGSYHSRDGRLEMPYMALACTRKWLRASESDPLEIVA